MKALKKTLAGIAAVTMMAGAFTDSAMAKDKHHDRHMPKAKNIIFMVPDGMGLSNTVAARIFANGLDGARLDFETLENIGYQSTYSDDSTVTDSAAAASAWASGEKFDNGEISCHGDYATGDCAKEVPTILELAEGRGKSSGLVATSQISHATPAAFAAHTISRNCGAEIARQYIVNDVDVIFGGGVYKTSSYCDVYPESFNAADKRQYIIDLAMNAGYTFVTNEDQMTAAENKTKVLGMFEQNGMNEGKTPEYFHVDDTAAYPDGEPTLAEMTDSALNILEKNKKGFFLMVEGSQIDWEDHGNNVKGQIAETIGFNEAVKSVLNWIDEKPERKGNTLVVIVADHDTGGFAVNGPYGSLSKQGDIVEPGWTSGKHTAVDTIIYSQGPGSSMMNAALDNTDLYHIMKSVMR